MPSARLVTNRTRFAQIAFDPAVRLFAERNQALFRALAHDAHHAFVQAHFHRLQRDEFRHTQTARVHQLQHGAVAQTQGCVDIRRTEQRFDLRFGERRRKTRRLLRRTDAYRRIDLCAVLAHRPAIVTAKHREPPVRRGGFVFLARRAIGVEIGLAGRVERCVAGLREPFAEQPQIAPVGIERVARQAVLEPQRVAERVDRGRARHKQR
jgi:hypothetical protein